MTGLPLFDAIAAREARDRGMATAAEGKKSLLNFVRKGSIEIAKTRVDRTVTTDDGARFLVENGISVHALDSATGSLFKIPEFEWTGELVKSVRVHAHQNLLRRWRLK